MLFYFPTFTVAYFSTPEGRHDYSSQSVFQASFLEFLFIWVEISFPGCFLERCGNKDVDDTNGNVSIQIENVFVLDMDNPG